MKTIAAFLLIAFSFPAIAGDILVGQYTYHFNEDTRNNDQYLDTHPLIGYAAQNYTVIAMKNTYNENSLSLLYTQRLNINKYLDLAASFGGASGYEKHKTSCKIGEVICVGYISADIHPESNSYGIVITFAPGVFVGAGLKFNFN